MGKTYIGWDNGTSGTIGIIKPEGDTLFIKTLIKKELSYTKTAQNITRVDVPEMTSFLVDNVDRNNCIAVLERPLVNPKMFKTTMSAMRSLEATLNILEMLDIPYMYVDSKEWQKELLPSGIKGSPELKKASANIGCRLFPMHSELIEKHGDADGILIAEWARRMKF